MIGIAESSAKHQGRQFGAAAKKAQKAAAGFGQLLVPPSKQGAPQTGTLTPATTEARTARAEGQKTSATHQRGAQPRRRGGEQDAPALAGAVIAPVPVRSHVDIAAATSKGTSAKAADAKAPVRPAKPDVASTPADASAPTGKRQAQPSLPQAAVAADPQVKASPHKEREQPRPGADRVHRTTPAAAAPSAFAVPQQLQAADGSTFTLSAGPAQQHSVVDQATLLIARASQTGQSSAQLQLHPADLGAINVQLTVAVDGQLNVTVSADTAATQALLADGLQGLERSLQNAGVSVGNIQVAAHGQAAGDLRERSSRREQPAESRRTAAAELTVEAADPAGEPRSRTERGRLVEAMA